MVKSWFGPPAARFGWKNILIAAVWLILFVGLLRWATQAVESSNLVAVVMACVFPLLGASFAAAVLAIVLHQS